MTKTYASLHLAMASLALLGASGCAGDDNEALLTDAEHEQQAVLAVKEIIDGELDAFAKATVALQEATPEPDADGWSAEADAEAVGKMRAAWKEARRAYEAVEGAIAVVFPDLDASTDARYDQFIEVSADADLFDDQGVIGVHAVERILWADAIPESVLAFESALPSYSPAAFPATQAEADGFKNKLVARLVADAAKMRDDFAGLALEASSAYRGVIGSIEEQVEKVDKAATGEEESRYAQHTLGDMRANLEGGKKTYQAFQRWVLSKGEEGSALDAEILAAYARLDAGYGDVEGDALPPLPEGWSSEAPTEEDLATPFGELYSLVRSESDPNQEGSLSASMTASASLLGIRALP